MTLCPHLPDMIPSIAKTIGRCLILTLLILVWSEPSFLTMPAAAADQTSVPGHQGHGAPATSTSTAESDDDFGDEELTVEITVEQQQRIGIRTAKAEVKPLHRSIRTIGRIENDERGLATINTKFEGWVERLYVNATGQMVRKGDPVAEIYSPELYATQQEYLNVLAWSGIEGGGGSNQAGRQKYYGSTNRDIAGLLRLDARSMLAAARNRLQLWDISDSQIRELEKRRTPARTITLHSPATGYVTAKPVVQGMRVMAGEKLLDIADLSTVWVVADFYEQDLPVVRVGQAATIGFAAFPGETIETTIDFLYPALAGETRTMKARLVVDNPEGRLRPQMYSDVLIRIDLGERLVVPESAVLNTGTRQLVYVDQGEGVFAPRDVSTGVKGEGMVEITEGLEQGELVTSEANFLIDSEARLKGVVQ